ncbi:non-specific lipid-transfer protein A-like [Prunus dulcis]|uniref:non-specific lipid-transfer protein A-like n=1 Tax=Prunus dulcis TaxID=3755 RepID=UPI0014823CD8|nr:non-specific lipid-transfer protein A-like [Prunus dulcis]
MMHPITKIIAVVIISMVSGAATGADPQSPYCNIILDHLNPCLPYILQGEVKPAKVCCDGVLGLTQYTNAKGGQQNICDCVKAAAILMGAPVDNFSKISSLPKSCGLSVTLPPISSGTDCSQVK